MRWSRRASTQPLRNSVREQATIEAEKQRQASTFGAAFEDYLQRKASKLKSGKDIEREMRRECKSWMASAACGYQPGDGERGVQSDGCPRRVRHKRTSGSRILRAFFNWVIDTGDFNLQVSPCAKLKPTVLIGPRNVRDRVLKDFEIAAYWRASEAMGYPFGKFFQLLALTALRRE